MAVSTWKRPNRDLATLAVLGLLAERPRHTYEIQRELHQRRKDFAAAKPRALYHAVDRLAAAELIELAETLREGRRPERVVYRATDAGRKELQHWLFDLLAQPLREPSAFTAAVSMIAYLPDRDALRALSQRVAALEGMIASTQAVLLSLTEQFGLPRLFLIEREYECNLWQAELAWVTWLMAELRSGALAVDQEWFRAFTSQDDPAAGASPDPTVSASARPSRPARPGTRRGRGPQLTVHLGGAS